MTASNTKTGPNPLGPRARAAWPRTMSALWLAVVLTGTSAGCAHHRDHPDHSLPPRSNDACRQHQGESWDTVLASPAVELAHEGFVPGYLPEHSRRDASLAVRGHGEAYPLDAWPIPAERSVFHSRRVRVSTSADTFYLFEYRDRRRPR